MSDGGSEDDGDDLDKLLGDLGDFTKQEVKAKPKLATTSKRRPGLQRQPSNTDDEGDEAEPEEKSRPLTSDPPKAPLAKPTFGLSNVPITAPLKKNPNANLLGNSPFTIDKDENKGPPKKSFLRAPLPKAGITKPTPPPPIAKADTDWLGIGSDSPIISANTTPLPERKDLKKGPGAEDYFDLGTSAVNPRTAILGEPSAEPDFFNKLKSKQAKPAEPPPPPLRSAPNPKPLENAGMKASNIEFVSESGLPSFLDRLTSKPQTAVDAPDTSSAAGDTTGGGPRKKVVTVRKTIAGYASAAAQQQPTLQVPSHVIDEEELKRMFQCQKQLYENQVTMLEQAYKEQIDCVSQSFGRKEELLKEEIRTVQKDYDDRVGRLKAELVEAELRPIQYRTQNQEYFHLLNKLSDQLKEVQQQQTADAQGRRGSISAVNITAISDLVGQQVEVQLKPVLKSLEGVLNQRMKEGSSTSASDQRIIERLNSIFGMLEGQAETQREIVRNSAQTNGKAGKAMEEVVGKVMKEQKKLRETLMKSTVTNMAQALESKHEDHRKKDKISMQIREFRRDVQRLLSDFDTKHESLQKSQSTLKGEQRHIVQSLHDLTTWLHQNLTNPGTAQMSINNQLSTTNEMELKILKDERNAMSEGIAKMNVERRRLQDERIQIEADRREIERQRSQIQDLETTLRVKVTDSDEAKKQIEASKAEHIKFSSDLSRKMTELEKERVQYHEKMQALELTTRLEKQRLAEERSEIIREREFLDKLRLQFLCPGCLRLVRSEGDGLDNPQQMRHQSQIKNYTSVTHDPTSPLSQPTAQLDLERKGRELKTLISNYYGDI